MSYFHVARPKIPYLNHQLMKFTSALSLSFRMYFFSPFLDATSISKRGCPVRRSVPCLRILNLLRVICLSVPSIARSLRSFSASFLAAITQPGYLSLWFLLLILGFVRKLLVVVEVLIVRFDDQTRIPQRARALSHRRRVPLLICFITHFVVVVVIRGRKFRCKSCRVSAHISVDRSKLRYWSRYFQALFFFASFLVKIHFFWALLAFCLSFSLLISDMPLILLLAF